MSPKDHLAGGQVVSKINLSFMNTTIGKESLPWATQESPNHVKVQNSVFLGKLYQPCGPISCSEWFLNGTFIILILLLCMPAVLRVRSAGSGVSQFLSDALEI